VLFVSFVLVNNHDLFPVSWSVVAVQVDSRRTLIGRAVGKRATDAGDVLPNQPPGPISVSNGKIREGEVPPWVSQAAAKSRDAEGLAGGSANENIDICIGPLLEFRHVATVRDAGEPVREHG
jgi:hypothetical protein